MRYAPEVAELIIQAAGKARSLGHSYVGSQHILLALAEAPGWTGQMLQSVGADANFLWDIAASLHGVGAPRMPLPQGLTATAKHILRNACLEAKQSD